MADPGKSHAAFSVIENNVLKILALSKTGFTHLEQEWICTRFECKEKMQVPLYVLVMFISKFLINKLMYYMFCSLKKLALCFYNTPMDRIAKYIINIRKTAATSAFRCWYGLSFSVRQIQLMKLKKPGT